MFFYVLQEYHLNKCCLNTARLSKLPNICSYIKIKTEQANAKEN
jgi:hypothetical protein